MHVKYLILGAGPTGLGAANRLREMGENSFLVLERQNYAGGLSASFQDRAGFTWDVGGHVVFSHYDYFDRLIEDLLNGEYLSHQRKAFVRLAQTWVPYPFQNNIRNLPDELVYECLEGLIDLRDKGALTPANFKEWIEAQFGAGIARLFMLPYNFKVWATPPELMGFKWIGERVSVIDLKRVLRNVIMKQDDVGFGPNNAFKFPLYGGTGEIFRRLAGRLGERVLYGQSVERVLGKTRQAICLSGLEVDYEKLLVTLPLDILLCQMLDETPESLREACRNLTHNGVFISGVGVEGPALDDKCWMYFPENNSPFYRVTNFHNYSPNNTPDPVNGKVRKRALMSEVSFSAHKPEDETKHLDSVLSGLVNSSLLAPQDLKRVVSTWEMKIDYGYPVPTLDRDPALKLIQPWLEERSIFGRGRFGGFKYEVANMDHCLMQGVEWAERMLTGKTESTYKL